MGLFRKTVLQAVYERQIDRSRNLYFEVVAMAASCTIYVRKTDFFLQI